MLIGGTAALALGAALTSSEPVKDIENLQENYFAQHGAYLQILPDNKLPHYESGSVKGKLGKNVPAGYRVDVYEAPTGHGYQIIYQDETGVHSKGYGVEAKERTWTRPLEEEFISATST